MPAHLLQADRDQAFADWAVPITLRTVTQTYDPDTLQRTETHTDATVPALLGTTPQQPTPHTASQHHATDLTVTIRREDLPDDVPPALLRILHDDVEHQVTAITTNPTAQQVTLHTRRA